MVSQSAGITLSSYRSEDIVVSTPNVSEGLIPSRFENSVPNHKIVYPCVCACAYVTVTSLYTSHNLLHLYFLNVRHTSGGM